MKMASPTEATSREHIFPRWLGIDHGKRPLIYAQVYEASNMSSLNYWLEIVFSAGIASFGLVLNSPAVIIGAMLISPLMGPIMATGLALAAGDLYLLIKAIANLVASIALAVAFSAAIVWLLPFHSVTAEVIARINPNLLDLGVALLSGLAGSVAVCRAGSGGAVTTLPGVAIAVALMPPLCAMGFGWGSGGNLSIMGGAGLLFLTNLVAIITSAFVVFLLLGMNSPELRTKMEDSRQDERFVQRLFRGPLARMLMQGSQLRWRILILVVLMASIAVPLRRALMQLASEARTRGAVQDVVKGMLPQQALVSQQIEVARGSVSLRLISTEPISAAKLQAAKEEMERRSGERVNISVSTVARQSDLTELMTRLTAPALQPAKPPEQSISEMNQSLIARVTPILQSIWPSEIPLERFSLDFSPDGIVLNVRYESARTLDKIPLGILTRECQEKLGVPALTLKAERVTPARRASQPLRQ
jgi:uncharacterized hydrophobic protein (TIGR00271 family)